MNFSGLEPGILLPAFAAGLLVLASHVPLGQAVLKRGIVFLDLAIAQIAGLGVVIAHSLGGEDSPWLTQTGAVTAALLGALFLQRMERFGRGCASARQEAIIGVTFVAAACLALILMSHDPHGAEHLQDLLVGQILWTSWSGLVPLAVITALMLAVWFRFNLRASPLGFYLLFALTITASVQVVGIYLVFASLIVPALVAGERLARGLIIGVLGYALGLIVSGLFDLPSGAAIVLALVAVASVAALFNRNPNR
ncbi:MAG: zinc/manganese transporter permease [Hydrogenophilales bacterium 28-61-23]|nr:MAG: zinc/manganese transporter permease [Hydrogenophilales bacterium 28-61-23]